MPAGLFSVNGMGILGFPLVSQSFDLALQCWRQSICERRSPFKLYFSNLKPICRNGPWRASERLRGLRPCMQSALDLKKWLIHSPKKRVRRNIQRPD
jgi:hypothetical protein